METHNDFFLVGERHYPNGWGRFTKRPAKKARIAQVLFESALLLMHISISFLCLELIAFHAFLGYRKKSV